MRQTNHKKVVFLDRDGVVNTFPGNGNYVTKVKDFHFIPGSLMALRLLKENGFTVFIISNQAGVGKGVYSHDKLKRINRKMTNGIVRQGGKVRRVFYCTHKSDEGCRCRKPGTGSIHDALRSIHKPMSYARNTFFIGDTQVDIQTGHNAGCKTVLVLSGRDNIRAVKRWAVKPDFISKNLLEASKIILHENSCHTCNCGGRA
ncbi:MAG: HAD-IIIA family hydrolase [Candidatus Omnitrophota bacterium]